jgi:hypothetical protein
LGIFEVGPVTLAVTSRYKALQTQF